MNFTVDEDELAWVTQRCHRLGSINPIEEKLPQNYLRIFRKNDGD